MMVERCEEFRLPPVVSGLILAASTVLPFTYHRRIAQARDTSKGLLDTSPRNSGV